MNQRNVKSITVLQASGGSGKTQTCRLIREALIRHASYTNILDLIPYNSKKDFRVVIDVFDTRIGINSFGDPGSLSELDLQELKTNGAEHIICACRTRGITPNIISNFAAKNQDCKLIWTKTYSVSQKPLIGLLNKQRANEIITMLKDHILRSS